MDEELQSLMIFNLDIYSGDAAADQVNRTSGLVGDMVVYAIACANMWGRFCAPIYAPRPQRRVNFLPRRA
jgi:hypothetical protein